MWRRVLVLTLTSMLLVAIPTCARADESLPDQGFVNVGIGGDGKVIGVIGVGGNGSKPAVPAPVAEMPRNPVVVSDGPVGSGPVGAAPGGGGPALEAPAPGKAPVVPKIVRCGDQGGSVTGRQSVCQVGEITADPAAPPAPAPDPAADPAQPAPPAGPTPEEIVAWAAYASTEMQLPLPVPQVGPDPSVNEWNMVAVGYPLWLWHDGPEHLTAHASVGGVTLQLDATRVATTFAMGDGTEHTCGAMTPWSPSVAPGTPSPTCGHTYTSKPAGGQASVTATSLWSVTWQAAGMSGTMQTIRTGARALSVGELKAVVNG